MNRAALPVAVSVVLSLMVIRVSERSVTSRLDLHLRAERLRLRAHFDSVLGELDQRDLSRLDASRQRSRSQLAAWLREYRDRGEFPLNDRLGSATPIFRDSRGVLCAMAYLIQRSGRADIVERVASARNNAYIGELQNDAPLVAWLDSVGLEADEAARIQPTYGPPANDHVDKDFALFSIGLTSSSLVTATVNVLKPNKPMGVLGVVAGSLTALVGWIAVTQTGEGSNADATLGGVDLVAGSAGLVAGIYALNHHGGRPVAQSSGASARNREFHIMLAPSPRISGGQHALRVGVTARM